MDLISQQYSECNAVLAPYLNAKTHLVDKIMNNENINLQDLIAFDEYFFLYFDSMELFLCILLIYSYFFWVGERRSVISTN